MNKNRFFTIAFILYCIIVAWLTVLNRTTYTQRIFRPDLFYEIRAFLAGDEKGKYYLGLFLKNILLFVPFGFLIPWKKSWKQVLLLGAGASAVIELTQYVFMRGEMEIDDVIANTIGALIGFVLYKLVYNLQRKFGESTNG